MELLSLSDLAIVIVLILIVVAISIRTKKLSTRAALTAAVIGLMTFIGIGYTGLAMLGAFFVMGVLATAHKKEQKALDGKHPQQRTSGQVFANGGVAAIMGILAIFDRLHADAYVVMAAGSLASAAADTLSSELGMVYGKRFYNILTFRKDVKGLDGVISLEGTLIGAAGAMVIAAVYSIAYGFNYLFFMITLAGVLGNVVDSLLGATLERKNIIGNDMVNFINTLSAALLAYILI